VRSGVAQRVGLVGAVDARSVEDAHPARLERVVRPRRHDLAGQVAGPGAVRDRPGRVLRLVLDVVEPGRGVEAHRADRDRVRLDERQLLVQGDGKINIDMQSTVMTLKRVIVSTEKASNIRSLQMGSQKIDIKTIKQVPVVFGEADVLRVALTMPGVKSVGEASTGLNVRGGSADQNLILFNDATIYNPAHFFGMFSVFNPEVVKDVELFKSSIPAKYGGRLSSVVNINSREGNKKNITGSAGIGLLTSRINIEGPLVKDKSSFIFGARTTYSDWLLQILPDQYKNSKANFYDLNLNITHEINKKNFIYLTAYLSKDKFNLNSDTAYNYGNKNLSLKWKHIFNNKVYVLVTGGYDNYNYEISSEKNPVNAYSLGFDINQGYFKTHVNYFVNSKHTVEFGLNSILYKLHPGNFARLFCWERGRPRPLVVLSRGAVIADEDVRAPSISAHVSINLDPGNRRIQPKPHALLARVEHEPHHHAVRIDEAIRRTECAADYVFNAKLRHELENVLRPDPFNVLHAERLLPLHVGSQIGNVLFAGRAEKITMRAVISRMPDHFVELRKEVDRILRHLNVDRRRELGAHAAHALARRAFALMRLALKHEHVGAALLSQMISDTRSDNAAADDDDVCGFHAKEKVRRKGGKVKEALTCRPRPSTSGTTFRNYSRNQPEDN